MTPHRLPVIRTLACACLLVVAGVAWARAQLLPMPGQSSPSGQFPPASGQSSPFPPPPGQSSAFPPPPGQSSPQGGGRSAAFPPPRNRGICDTFPEIRAAVEKRGLAIQAAGKRKAGREEACPLFKRFAIAEANMVKFLVKNKTACGVPDEAIKVAKTNHAKTLQVRDNVCGAGPAAPAGPSLSDALGGPIIADDTSTKKSGSSPFDTLTGNALSR
jgi:hypothetical protein